MIPAVILANRLNIQRVYTFGLASYTDENQREEIQAYYYPQLSTIKPDEKIVVIDDILDSGNTFKYIDEWLSQTHHTNVVNCALFYKVLDTEHQYIPDDFIYSESVDEEFWVSFPWEKK